MYDWLSRGTKIESIVVGRKLVYSFHFQCRVFFMFDSYGHLTVLWIFFFGTTIKTLLIKIKKIIIFIKPFDYDRYCTTVYVLIFYKMVFNDVFYLEAKQRLKGKKSCFFRVNHEIKSSRIKAGIQYSNSIQLKIYCL